MRADRAHDRDPAGLHLQVWRQQAKDSVKLKDRRSARQKVEKLLVKYGKLSMAEYIQCAQEMRVSLLETKTELEDAIMKRADTKELMEMYTSEYKMYHQFINTYMGVVYGAYEAGAKFEPEPYLASVLL